MWQMGVSENNLDRKIPCCRENVEYVFLVANLEDKLNRKKQYVVDQGLSQGFWIWKRRESPAPLWSLQVGMDAENVPLE